MGTVLAVACRPPDHTYAAEPCNTPGPGSGPPPLPAGYTTDQVQSDMQVLDPARSWHAVGAPTINHDPLYVDPLRPTSAKTLRRKHTARNNSVNNERNEHVEPLVERSACVETVCQSSVDCECSRDEGVPMADIQQAVANHGCSGDHASRLLGERCLLDLLPRTPTPAVASVNDSREVTTHARLHAFMSQEFDLTRFGAQRGDRVAVMLPNGPEAGVCVMAVAAFCTCAPINPSLKAEEVKYELVDLQCTYVVTSAPGASQALPAATMEMLRGISGMRVIFLHPSTTHVGLFELSGEEKSCDERPARVANRRTDTCLVLHTSGTSGTKKVVPYTMHKLLVGACCVAASWALSPSDRAFNMMPLYHVGGIVRNLIAPVLSGGATILCRSFDAATLLDVLEGCQATWYYMVPTMHQLILQEHKNRGSPVLNHRLRMIANAGAGLSPVLAAHLRDTFHCAVLPSYGMTECMPISSPPLDYHLERPGSSGRAVGPAVAILDRTGVEVARGTVGDICVRGEPLIAGYENNSKANAEAFYANGYFGTGDVGYMDADGWLYVTGRSKEVINRGGEIISPLDIEDAVNTHPRVKDCVAFSAPHAVLQETVALAVVPVQGLPRPGLRELRAHVSGVLHPSKWPMVLVYMHNDTPKSATGKPLRIGLAKRLGLPELEPSMPIRQRLYDANCPARGTAISVRIPSTRAHLDFGETARVLKGVEGVCDVYVASEGPLAGAAGSVTAYVSPSDTDVKRVREAAASQLHGYLLPDKIVPVAHIPYEPVTGQVDECALAVLKAEACRTKAPRTPLETELHEMFQQVLETGELLAVDVSLLDLGGNSVRARALASHLRTHFGMHIAANALYAQSIEQLAKEVDAHTHMCVAHTQTHSTPPCVAQTHTHAHTHTHTQEEQASEVAEKGETDKQVEVEVEGSGHTEKWCDALIGAWSAAVSPPAF